jgi:heavy metal sensor kinase
MFRSFKLKIALSSVLLSGTLLLAFGLFFVEMSYKIGIDRTDRELRALVDADMRKTQPRNHWKRFDESLKTLFGENAAKQFILKVVDAQDTLLFESSQWQVEIGDAPIPRPAPVDAVNVAQVDPERPRPFNKRQKERKPAPPPLDLGTSEFASFGNWRIMAIRNPEITLQLGISLIPLNAEIMRFRNALLLAIPVTLLVMIGIGWLLAQLALRPVNTIARTAKKVTALHLDERIPGTKADHEFRQLIDVINEMLNRLEAGFKQAVRFSADAAHELKTPLTILQGELEHALQTATDGSDDQRTYKESLDEVQRLRSIIRKLLLLAQADSGRMPLNKKPLDFTSMIDATCEDIGLLNPELEVQADLQPGIKIQGDAALLTQVIQNLTGNAIKFSHGESPITLSLKSLNGRVEFSISNRGSTIPEADRDKIFDRFFRADKAHSRKTDGTGLGLSLAREIALAHGGRLELLKCGEEQTTFRLVLPGRITES